jgi:CHRD domain
MRELMLSMCVMALALLTFAHLAGADEMKVKATLTGAAEVPGPGDNDGGGTVQVTLNPDKGEVCYELTVKDIQEATAAHIHEGAAGKEGAVKVAFDAPKTGSAKGCKSADAAVVKTIMDNPANYYVNVHNAEFPKGAVRGQLAK